jgi:hypothetical protein
MFRKHSLFLVMFLLLMWTSIAWAAGEQSTDPLTLAREIWSAIASGNYGLGLSLFGVLASVLLGKWGKTLHPWFGTGTGKAWITIVFGYSMALVIAAKAGAQINGSFFWAAVVVVASSAGFYSLTKAIVLEPLQRWVVRGAPSWVAVLTDGLAWFYDRMSPRLQGPK